MSTESENLQTKNLSPEFYMHLTFFVMALIIIVLSFAMSVTGTRFVYLPGSVIPMPETCTSKLFFGIECPGCGMTRAFISISHGEFLKAWNFNPASFIAYIFVAAQLPWQLIQMWLLWKGQAAIDRGWIFVLPVLAAASMLIQWLIRVAM